MSNNQDTTTTTVAVEDTTTTTVGQNTPTTTTVVVTTTSPQNPPVVTIPCQDQNCSDPGFITTTTTATVAETVGGASGELPVVGGDVAYLVGAALTFVAVGALVARAARREQRGLGR